MKKLVFGFFIWICIPLIVLEIACRVLFGPPFQFQHGAISEIHPVSCLQFDSLLGFSLKSGSYEFICQNGLRFQATHDQYGHRTAPDNEERSGKLLNFYGGSVFYGYGLNDTAVFTHEIRKGLPAYQVNNCAIFGHSMTSSLLSIRQQISLGLKPDVAVISYATYNLSRNVYSPLFRRNLSSQKNAIRSADSILHYAYARLNDGHQTLSFHTSPIKSFSIPLSTYSSFFHQLEIASANFLHKQLHPDLVDQILVSQILSTCKENGILVAFAFIDDSEHSQPIRNILDDNHIPYLDLAVDYHLPAYNLMPLDNHPNGKAHDIYARRILDFLHSHGVMNN